jgi:hypothetical protein
MIAFLLGAALGAVVVLVNFIILSHIWKKERDEGNSNQ